MPIGIRDKKTGKTITPGMDDKKTPAPISKSKAFADYRKKHGSSHKADPKHPMNAEGKGVMRKKSGGKLKMVEKNGKKVPFYAADGVGKMAKGGSVKVKSGDTLSQIAKKRGVTLKSLLAANPSIKNANQIKVGQNIKVPPVTNKGKTVSLQAGSKSKNPYEGMTQTEMNMLRSKDKRANEAFTRTAQMQQKDASGRTSPNTKKANAVKEKRSGRDAMLEKARKLRAQKQAAKKKPRPAIPSNDIAAKKGGMMKAKGYKHGGTVRGAGAATKGKRYGRCG